jgi:hypothetical protein
MDNVVDFAAYRFARDLRLKDADAAQVWADALRPARPTDALTEADAAHRARMLQHLADTAAAGPSHVRRG